MVYTQVKIHGHCAQYNLSNSKIYSNIKSIKLVKGIDYSEPYKLFQFFSVLALNLSINLHKITVRHLGRKKTTLARTYSSIDDTWLKAMNESIY